jgi:hypothetical protein
MPTGSGGPPSLLSKGYWTPGGVKLTTHLLLLPRKKCMALYLHLEYVFMACAYLSPGTTSRLPYLSHVLSWTARTLGSCGRVPLEAWPTSASFCVVLSCVGRGLAVGRSPLQGTLPICLIGFIVSEVNSESEQPRGPNLWSVQQQEPHNIGVKAKVSLCLTKYRTTKTSALDGGKWSVSRPGRIIAVTQWTGSRVDPRSHLVRWRISAHAAEARVDTSRFWKELKWIR